MEYQIIKVFNNNVVLASQKQNQVILISKGIGFGKKAGDTIQENANIEKVFHELPSNTDQLDLKEMSVLSDKIQKLTSHIINIAEQNLGSLNEHSEKMLMEHIEFAIERLKMGLIIENPFIDEIVILYKKEYDIAGIAREYILETIGLDIGEEEQGFIALHLRSARKNKSVNEIMKRTRVYKECLELVESEYNTIISEGNLKKEFLRVLRFYIECATQGKDMDLTIKNDVIKNLRSGHRAAVRIANRLEKERNIKFNEGLIIYMAIDIHKLISLMSN